YGALMLHEKPELRERLRAVGRAYAEAFAQEVRRLCPFFAFIGGRVREPFDWRGKHFAQGEWVVLDLYGTNIDPRSHRNATSFDPDRFLKREVCPFAFVPQGGGDVRTGHRCPGEDVTVVLARVGIEMLACEMRYDVPPQDLHMRLSRIPARPKSRFIIENVRPERPARTTAAVLKDVAAAAK
ncbi:MAG: cytochrome P450, partial [Methyloceanibacter sp.]